MWTWSRPEYLAGLYTWPGFARLGYFGRMMLAPLAVCAWVVIVISRTRSWVISRTRSWALMVKRLHDIGWSGAHMIWIIVLGTAAGRNAIPNSKQKPPPDQRRLLDLLTDGTDRATRDAILAANPARLHGFPPSRGAGG